MQNPIQKFRQSSIVFKKPGNLDSPTTLQFNIFCWNFIHVPTYQCLQKGVGDLFAKTKNTCNNSQNIWG